MCKLIYDTCITNWTTNSSGCLHGCKKSHFILLFKLGGVCMEGTVCVGDFEKWEREDVGVVGRPCKT